MQNLVHIYEENSGLIQKFIMASLRQVDTSHLDIKDTNKLFSVFPSLELIYECATDKRQISANIYRSVEDSDAIGSSREYLIDHSNDEFSFHEPYISTATGSLCLTVVYKTDNGYFFLDFRIRRLLERFDLIESRSGINLINKIAYGLIASGLLFFAVFLVIYGMYDFSSYLFGDKILSMETVFKPIIALTLGLAVYDLGKTILDQEVLPKTHHKTEGFNVNTLLKFSVSIIIALLIEALLVVFKISLHDYTQLPYAAMLIGSVSSLMLVFAIFVYLSKKD